MNERKQGGGEEQKWKRREGRCTPEEVLPSQPKGKIFGIRWNLFYTAVGGEFRLSPEPSTQANKRRRGSKFGRSKLLEKCDVELKAATDE